MRGIYFKEQHGDTMKKLSAAILTAVCALGVTAVEAAPKATIKVTAPSGTAGADKAALGKGMPWLPCTVGAAALSGVTTTSFMDKIQIDLDVTNANDDKSSDKSMDYDLYVIFVNYSTGTPAYYALIPPSPGTPGGPTLKAYSSDAVWKAATPSDYRFMKNTDFGTEAAYKSTLFGTAISLESASLPQGLWSVMTVMTNPSPTSITAITPTLVANAVPETDTAGLFHDPKNWATWSMQTFILGTPYVTSTGTSGDGKCK